MNRVELRVEPNGGLADVTVADSYARGVVTIPYHKHMTDLEILAAAVRADDGDDAAHDILEHVHVEHKGITIRSWPYLWRDIVRVFENPELPRLVLMVAEVKGADSDATLQQTLDEFREMVIEQMEAKGITLTRSSFRDLARFKDVTSSENACGYVDSVPGQLD